jgi:hypothetical protein
MTAFSLSSIDEFLPNLPARWHKQCAGFQHCGYRVIARKLAFTPDTAEIHHTHG